MSCHVRFWANTVCRRYTDYRLYFELALNRPSNGRVCCLFTTGRDFSISASQNLVKYPLKEMVLVLALDLSCEKHIHTVGANPETQTWSEISQLPLVLLPNEN